MQLMLPQLKPNSLPLDVASIRLSTYQRFQKLSLSQTLSKLQRRYLIQQSTYSKYTQLPFLRNSGNVSSPIVTTQLSFGNALANVIGLYSNSVDKDNKQFWQTLLLPYKSSWDFSMKSKYNDIIQNWKMTFHASDQKGQQFLKLVDDEDNPIEPSYINSGSWLKFIGHFNSLYARATRAIINYAPISEYRLCFFLKEDFKCLCGQYSRYWVKTSYSLQVVKVQQLLELKKKLPESFHSLLRV